MIILGYDNELRCIVRQTYDRRTWIKGVSMDLKERWTKDEKQRWTSS